MASLYIRWQKFPAKCKKISWEDILLKISWQRCCWTFSSTALGLDRAPNGISLVPGVSLIFVLLPNFSIFYCAIKQFCINCMYQPFLISWLVVNCCCQYMSKRLIHQFLTSFHIRLSLPKITSYVIYVYLIFSCLDICHFVIILSASLSACILRIR
jgi:hypothetical protein